MPGMYHNGQYDLAGFVVGIAEKDKLITGDNIKVGDKIIGIASSGVHANGYSLVRKIITDTQVSLSESFEETSLGTTLLRPTKIYVQLIKSLMAKYTLKGMAHITGGGITENLPRILPADCCAEIDLTAWDMPAIFKWLAAKGKLPQADMLRTFNCGLGMMLVVSAEDEAQVLKEIQSLQSVAWSVGKITQRPAASAQVCYV